jgi:hypothetical protein
MPFLTTLISGPGMTSTGQRRSPRQMGIYLLSMFFAATPIAFALIRAVSTGYDLRYAWMALASFLGAALVMRLGNARNRAPKMVIGLGGVALVVAMLCAAGTGLLLGARGAVGIALVAFSFGFCWAVSYVLDTLSRLRVEGLEGPRDTAARRL